MNVVETVVALKWWEKAQKCVYLVSLSTITMMTLFPLEFNKPMMKSMETSSQHWLGMDNGCKIPGVLIVSTLFCWKTKYSAKRNWTSVLRPSPKNSLLTLWKVFKNPERPPTGEVCNSKSTFYLSWELLHKYKWSLYHSESFFHVNVSYSLESYCNLWIRVHTSSSFFHSSLVFFIQSGWMIEIA